MDKFPLGYSLEQQAAIVNPVPVVIVPAGPGAGKSRTLVGRVAYRVERGMADPRRVVILTFTNNGAKVFRERLAALRIEVRFMGTLHSYCMRLIQVKGAMIGYRPRTVTVVTEEAKALLVEEVRADLGRKITDKALKENATPDAKQIWAEYAWRLKRANMIDNDGILRDGLKLIEQRAGDEIDDLLVDERQDSGSTDSAIYWALPVKLSRFFVGDVDQCIYGFRGARPDIFVEEAKRFGGTSLTVNYRSDKAICRVANQLIRHNHARIDKPIVPADGSGEGAVVVGASENEGDEIFCVWTIIKRESSKGVAFSNMAVLARTNAIVDKLRDTLSGLGVPILRARPAGRFLPADWGYALNSLGLAIDPSNDFMAEAVLKHRGVSPEKLREFKIGADKEDEALSTVAMLPSGQPAGLTEALAALSVMGVSKESFAIVVERSALLPKTASPSDLLVDLSNRRGWEEEIAPEQDAVTVTTIHGAKGSEWDVVFVVGLEEDVLPRIPKMVPAEAADLAIEEERRLCFVAVTRAKHRLYLTWARNRTAFFGFGRSKPQHPSRFITEMFPPDTTGGYEIPPEER